MAGVALLAVVALLVACGPPAATDVAVAPVATPTLALPSPAQHPTPAPTAVAEADTGLGATERLNALLA